MTVISSFGTDSNIQDVDLLLGSDGNNNNVTKNFTVGGLKTYIANAIEVDNLTDENFYLTGVTAATDTGVITFSITGADDQTLDLGTSIFKDANYFATANHTHTLSDIVGNNDITTTQLDVAGTGTSGQILTSDGTGGFNWTNASSITDTNNYLNSISKSGNTLTFAVSGDIADQTFTFGESAFLSVNSIVEKVESKINIANITNGLGSLSKKETVGPADIDANAITAAKIAEGAVTEEKLNVSNSPTNGHVLTYGGDNNFTWAANSASNYYINNISKNGNKLTFETTGGLAAADYPAYTFGGAAFKDIDSTTGRDSNKVPPANHTHLMAHVTDAGALASLDNVTTQYITNGQITAAKLSPTVGTDGQVLSVDSGGDLQWVTLTATTTNFLTLPDTPSSFGTAGQILKVNTAADALEFADLEVGAAGIDTTNSPTANKILAVDTNGDLEWVDQGGLANNSVTPVKINGLLNNGTSGQIIQTDGDGTFSYVDADAAIGAGDITTAKIADDAITSAKIADNAIVTAAINSGAVTGNKIASGTIDTIHLADDGVTRVKLEDGIINTGKLSDDAVTNAKIADGAISFENLEDEFKTVATAVTLSSSTTTATCSFSSAAVFPITLASDATNTTITYSNATIGQTKILKVTGSGGTGTVTITGTKLSGTLDQTSSTVNYIQVTCIGSSEFIYTISQSA